MSQPASQPTRHMLSLGLCMSPTIPIYDYMEKEKAMENEKEKENEEEEKEKEKER